MSLTGKGTANVHVRQSLVALAGNVWSAAFRAHFIAFWLFAQQHQLRVSRLDDVQHAAIHGLNAATRLVAHLDEETALRVQRRALSDPSAGILTIAEVAAKLGIQVQSVRTAPNGGARSAPEGAQILALYSAKEAAQLLCYARVAWLSEELLAVDLGPAVAARQLAALVSRYGVGTADELPMHATHVYTCTECHRVANACVVAATGVPFNELGVSSCQIATECLSEGKPMRLHCAKRSSAALRTALVLEADMKRRRIEECPIDADALRRLKEPRRAAADDNGIAARVRRDAKSAHEQRPAAVACGEQPMVAVRVVGRALRLHKMWYALCSYCASLIKVQPHLHRHGAEICCLRCDPSMVTTTGVVACSGEPAKVLQHQCRYCGVRMKGAGRMASGWREVKAPLDVAGNNAALPGPLRRVHYCRQHFRGWVIQAHRVLQTRVILAHLAHNAKPLHNVETHMVGGATQPCATRSARKTHTKAKSRPKTHRK
jgi:hypothetical protein